MLYTVRQYRKQSPAVRAVGAFFTLKELGRFEENMRARELTDEEVVAGILLGTIK